jgi:hypothetical protein
MLRQHAALLASTFEVPSRAIWRSIRMGRPIGGDGILLVPHRRPRARTITPGIEFEGNSSGGPAERSNRLPAVMERAETGVRQAKCAKHITLGNNRAGQGPAARYDIRHVEPNPDPHR